MTTSSPTTSMPSSGRSSPAPGDGRHDIYRLKREVLEFRRAAVPLETPAAWAHEDMADPARAELAAFFATSPTICCASSTMSSPTTGCSPTSWARTSRRSRCSRTTTCGRSRPGSPSPQCPTMIAGIYGMNFDYMPELTLASASADGSSATATSSSLPSWPSCVGLFRAFKRRSAGSDRRRAVAAQVAVSQPAPSATTTSQPQPHAVPDEGRSELVRDEPQQPRDAGVGDDERHDDPHDHLAHAEPPTRILARAASNSPAAVRAGIAMKNDSPVAVTRSSPASGRPRSWRRSGRRRGSARSTAPGR